MAERDVSHILIVSDSTGETAEKITRAVLSQFKRRDVSVVRYPNVRTEEQLKDVFRQAQALHGIVVYTMVSEPMRTLVQQEALRRSIPTVDLLGPLLTAMTQALGARPEAEPGLLHRVDKAYYRRIEAIQFAVKHDDGQNLPTLHQADMVLVGVSRTGKTPLSMYLAQYGYKVANFPLFLGQPLPRQLFSMDQRRIIGLTIGCDKLVQIRRARMSRLKSGADLGMDYDERSAIMSELEYARRIYQEHPDWPVVDVTVRAVEEVAAEILGIMRARREKPPA